MRIATRCLSCLAAAALAVVVGCGGGETPPMPTAGSSPPVQPDLGWVRVVSGIEGTPVAGASVLFDGDDEPVVSGPSGEAWPNDYILRSYGTALGTAVNVDARGFLPRRTRIGSDGIVTLWPVADDAEAEAVRRMVYGDQEVRQPFDLGPILVSVLGEGAGFWGSEVGRAWQAEALAFGARFGLRYGWSTVFQYEPNEMSVLFDTAGQCSLGARWGFCRAASPYFASFVVRPARAGDAATIRRVLASAFLGPNPLPGLLNPDAPADELSPFEERTPRMVLLRRLPSLWPDTDG